MIDNLGAGSPKKSNWSSLSESLIGRAGQALELISGVASAYTKGAKYKTEEAQSRGISENLERQAVWDETTLISTALQRQAIEAQTLQAKIAAHDKWLWRRGATRARYAAAGIAVDVGTPLAVTAEILAAQAEEISLINLNDMIRKWNEAELPSYRAKAAIAETEHDADLAEVDAEKFRQTARIAKTAGLLETAAKVADFIGEFA